MIRRVDTFYPVPLYIAFSETEFKEITNHLNTRPRENSESLATVWFLEKKGEGCSILRLYPDHIKEYEEYGETVEAVIAHEIVHIIQNIFQHIYSGNVPKLDDETPAYLTQFYMKEIVKQYKDFINGKRKPAKRQAGKKEKARRNRRS